MNKSKKIIFILGGARSGKSSLAQKLAEQHGKNVLFIATAQALDDEMKKRIEIHKKSRPHHWITAEQPTKINKVINKFPQIDTVVIDCITLLVSNVIIQTGGTKTNDEKAVQKEISSLISTMQTSNLYFILVSNEVGLGIVPESKLARNYRDILGKVNQQIASIADEVYFLISGIPLKLK